MIEEKGERELTKFSNIILSSKMQTNSNISWSVFQKSYLIHSLGTSFTSCCNGRKMFTLAPYLFFNDLNVCTTRCRRRMKPTQEEGTKRPLNKPQQADQNLLQWWFPSLRSWWNIFDGLWGKLVQPRHTSSSCFSISSLSCPSSSSS